jgi:hypothetical protein
MLETKTVSNQTRTRLINTQVTCIGGTNSNRTNASSCLHLWRISIGTSLRLLQRTAIRYACRLTYRYSIRHVYVWINSNFMWRTFSFLSHELPQRHRCPKTTGLSATIVFKTKDRSEFAFETPCLANIRAMGWRWFVDCLTIHQTHQSGMPGQSLFLLFSLINICRAQSLSLFAERCESWAYSAGKTNRAPWRWWW